MYVSNPDSPDDAKANVISYAGRTNGRDLKWTFNNAVDDQNSDVNQPLKAAIVSYQSALVAVQGEASLSAQTLSSPANKNQSVPTATAINPIVFNFGGDATDAIATDLPAGLTAVSNTVAKTLTITGAPTANGTYTVTTIGNGTAIIETGTITIAGTSLSDEVHNFTISGKTSAFYAIAGELSTGKGTVMYDGLTLNQCMKMGSSTIITYATTQASNLTLVFVELAGTVNVDGKNYIATQAIAPNTGSSITISLPAGNHTITKKDSHNLFYMKTSYSAMLGTDDYSQLPKITLYPNPVTNELYILSDQKVQNVSIYSLNGVLIKSISGEVASVELSNLNAGKYLVKVATDRGIFTQKIIKK